MSKYIWLTRPREDSEAMARDLAAEGIRCVIAPVLRIEPIADALGEKPQGIVLTSRHALLALESKSDWRDVPVYAVGGATAGTAHALGFRNVSEGGGDALSLAVHVAERAQGQRLLYPCGEDTRHDLPALLATRGVRVTPVTVYRAVAADALPADFAAQAKELTGAVFFSARSADIAQQLLKKAELPASKLAAYCLSLDVAAAVGPGWRAVQVAQRPTAESMTNLIVSV